MAAESSKTGLSALIGDNKGDGSDSDSNFQTSYHPTAHDRTVLEEAEQEETLLAGHSYNDGGEEPSNGGLLDVGGRERRRERRRRQIGKKRRRKEGQNEDGSLMHEMEEGGSKDDAGSQSSSSSLELDLARQKHAPSAKACTLSHPLAAPANVPPSSAEDGFTSHTSQRRPSLPNLFNGTSIFGPTTILLSLDGFRADFLYRNLTPTLNSFIANGVSPKYMLPSFPSVTFPNHYTLVTGLYIESHGVVGNSFWDAGLGEEFYYTDPARSMQPKWWSGGEPLWVTAEKQNVKTAIHMWPGSEAHIQPEPTYLDKFNGSEILSLKVERILQLLDMPGSDDVEVVGAQTRPQLIAAYVPNVDVDGHKHGPNSTQIRQTISSVDDMLTQLFAGITMRNLSDIVNVVVVSDHGMATTSTDRLVQLDDLIDLDLVEHIDGWPLYGLRPKRTDDLRQLYDKLKAESLTNANYEVYLRDEDMPERYHFSNNERIAPLWVIPSTGWAIVHKEDFDVKAAKAKGAVYNPKGLHGYDHEHPLMRAIFVARGPAFPHQPNSRLEPFQNVEVYNIICDSLGIEPKANNGTLRLPLKPVGLHSDETEPTDSIPTDLPSGPETTVEDGVTSENIELNGTAGVAALANSTTSDVQEDNGHASSFYETWKQMIAKIKATISKLKAKLHGGSSSTAPSAVANEFA